MHTQRRYLVYGAMFVMMAISYIDRVNLSVATPTIAREFGLGPVGTGYALSSYLWTYLVFLVPVGIAVDRWGARAVGAGSLVVWSIGGALTGLTGGFGSLVATRMVLGAGEAASYPVGGRAIQEWAPPEERGRAAAWLNSGAYAGLAVGALVVGWLISEVGWRASFVVTGAAGVLVAAGWWALYRRPSTPEAPPTADVPEALPARTALAGLLRRRSIWGLALTQGCAGYTLYLFMTWLPSYLADTRDLDVVRSGAFTAVPYAVAVVLGLLLGRVSDVYLRRSSAGIDARRRLIAGCLLVSSVILATPLVSETWVLLTLFSIALTCVSTAMGLCLALTGDLLRDGRRAGVAISCVIFGGNTFGLLAPIVTGYVLALSGSYSAAFVLAGVLLLSGAVTVLTLTRRPLDAPAAGTPRPRVAA
ncbi:MFS transporter [Actinomycetospora sp. CA-053990]|uniref:MFS transporter n=1 Tax=Actinomycetospora sp. CA-053990 TaxID=3239891 RepID=UPI003D8B3E3E